MKPMVVTAANKDRFKTAISGDKPVLMLYYASWCGHCQALHPTWETLKKKLEAQSGILVGEVEYANMAALPAGLQNIRGFPTIQVLSKGKVKTEYQGDRTLASLSQFALSHAGPKPMAAAVAKPKKAAVAKKKKAAAKK